MNIKHINGVCVYLRGLPGGRVIKNPSANAGDIGYARLIPGSGRSPGGGHDNRIQYSYLENPMDRKAWWVTVHGVTKKRTWLSAHTRVYNRVTCC